MGHGINIIQKVPIVNKLTSPKIHLADQLTKNEVNFLLDTWQTYFWGCSTDNIFPLGTVGDEYTLFFGRGVAMKKMRRVGLGLIPIFLKPD